MPQNIADRNGRAVRRGAFGRVVRGRGPRYLGGGRLARADTPPIRSGPEGSSRNGVRLGRCPAFHPCPPAPERPAMLAAADLIRGLISGLVLAFALFLSWSVATRPHAVPQGSLDDARARQGGAVSFQSAPARDGAGAATVALRRALPRGGAVPDTPPPVETRFTATGAGYRIHVP